LIAAAVAIVGALAALLIALAPKRIPKQESTTPILFDSGSVFASESSRFAPNIDPAPNIDHVPDVAGRDAEVREFIRPDGVTVRDHRRGTPSVDLRAPLPVPIEHARVKPEVIIAVRNEIRPKVHECIRKVDAATGGRVQARLGVQIQAGELTVVEVSAKELDADRVPAKRTELSDCVENVIQTIRVPANGHDDVSYHSLTFPFVIR